MESNLDTSISVALQEDLFTAGKEVALPGRDYLLNSGYFSGLRKQRKPSPAAWHVMLILGDGVLLLSLIAFVFRLAQPFNLRSLAAGNAAGAWMFLALISWSIAVNITRAQKLNNATSRFRSLLYAICTLALMLILWSLLIYSFFGSQFQATALVGLFSLLLGSLVFATWRILFAEIMNLPRFRTRAVIVGVNAASALLVKEIENLKRPTVNVLGYISEHVDERVHNNALSILGGKRTLRYLASHSIIDMIIMTFDYKPDPGLFQEALEASQFGVSLIPMPVFYESISGKIPVEHIGHQWYAVLQADQILSLSYMCWKKILDFAAGLFGLLLLGLVTPVIALFIRLDSPGPIFYSQVRLGFRGKPFRIYKFRSMYSNAEESGRAVWAKESDSRVTRIGRFMRATHLDELPQLFNIIRGDMSLIGPRPEREAFVAELEKTIPFYRNRLTVKPGLTGWAQVKYHYASSGNDALIKLQYDLYYIKHRSILLDIFIVLKTALEVLTRQGI